MSRDLKNTVVFNVWKEKNHQVSLPVKGRSMYPIMDDRDLVTLVDTPHSKIRKGDIVAFLSKGGFVVHRVIRSFGNKEDFFFCLKGDSSPFFTWIKGRQVLGKIVKVQSNGRVIKLTRFPWTLCNRFIAFLGSCWICFCRKREEGERNTESEIRAFAFSNVKKRTFLFLKAISFTLIKLLYCL